MEMISKKVTSFHGLSHVNPYRAGERNVQSPPGNGIHMGSQANPQMMFFLFEATGSQMMLLFFAFKESGSMVRSEVPVVLRRSLMGFILSGDLSA